jgi:putative spermidine/putrescine transport system permease protein
MRSLERQSFNGVVWSIAAVALVLLTAPTLVVLATSFTAGESLKFPPPGLSFRWYIELLDSNDLQEMAERSLLVATLATGISATLGTLAALALVRARSSVARIVDSLFMSPLIVPWIAIGLGILLVVSLLGLPFSTWMLVAGHAVVCVPFVLRTTMASLAQLDPTLLEASRSLGASPLYGFRRITLPAIGPGIAAGSFLAFIASFDNVPISLFLADARSQMLPIRMWQMIQADLDPRVASISTVIVVFTFILMVLMERLAGLSRQLAR